LIQNSAKRVKLEWHLVNADNVLKANSYGINQRTKNKLKINAPQKKRIENL